MGRCPYDKLSDVLDVLESVRGLNSELKEPKPGIFYFKSKAFLHFHLEGEERWADVRDGKVWGDPLPLPFGASATVKRNFLKCVNLRFSLVKEQA